LETSQDITESTENHPFSPPSPVNFHNSFFDIFVSENKRWCRNKPSRNPVNRLSPNRLQVTRNRCSWNEEKELPIYQARPLDLGFGSPMPHSGAGKKVNAEGSGATLVPLNC